MNRDELLYLAPYLFSLAITFGVFIYAWRHRRARGVGTYVWFVGVQSLTILGFIFELITPSLQIKILWDMFQWITDAIVFVAFFIFATEFTQKKFRYPAVIWSAILIVQIILVFLLLTDPIFHQIYPNPHLVESYPFQILEYDFTSFVYIYAIVSVYLVPLYGVGLLLGRALHANGIYRAQFVILGAGFSIPIFVSILALLNISIGPQRDISPITLALGNVVVAIGLFRYGLFDIAPIAREQIIENMADSVIVLDATNRVVDINSAALDILGGKYSHAVGRGAGEVFAIWPDVIEMLEISHEQSREISIHDRDDRLFYDINISPIIVDKKRNLIGHIVVGRDITRQKTLEVSYRILSEELEKRVVERTAEVTDAYDTTLEGWANALELRDKETEGHSRRVTETTLIVARALGLSEEELVHVRRGALLHDIGKMGIPDEILRKKGALTNEERGIINGHPKLAYDLLSKIRYLEKALDIPYNHHEKWNGTGYPRGLRGNEIPLTARIFTVVDVWDALSFDRPYRNAWPEEQIIQYLKDESRKHFDPDIVSTFLGLLERGEI